MQFDSQSLWLYLYFPKLQLDTIEQSSASDNEKANDEVRAVYQSASNQLVQVNKNAVEHGLSAGMGLAKASLLYDQLKLYEYNPAIEENCIEQIAQQLYLVTSDIALAPPKGLILRVQRMLNMHQGLNNYWRIVKYCLADHNYQCYAACGFSIQTAKLIALHKVQLITNNKAKIQTVLNQCQLQYSDLDKKDIEKLARIGVQTLGELVDIPTPEVANRISKHSMQIVNELLGLAPARVKFFQPSSKFHDYLELLYEIDSTEKLIPIINRCLDKLEHFLYVRNARSMRISLHFFLRESTPLKLEFFSALPIYRKSEWSEIIALRLEREKLSSPIHAIETHCLEYEITPISNDDLFAKKSQRIAGLSLISRLLNRLGEDKVKKIRYHADFRPESSSKLTTINSPKLFTNNYQYKDRPGILLEQPQPLLQKVNVIKGPERIVSGWWDNHQITRDYFIAEDIQGQQLWIFKTPEEQWYLHGFFV